MKIQYCSDLHLEFKHNNRFVKNHPLIPAGEVLILAGDIVPFADLEKHSAFFDFVSEHFEMVYWLPGNHEYYGSDILNKDFVTNEKIRENVWLVNNVVITYNKVDFIFTTLWSEISPRHEWEISRTGADFSAINYDRHVFTVFYCNSLHKQCRYFLEEALTKPTHNKRVVVTHHVPTLFHYPEKYINSNIREAFSVELFDVIESSNADYWIYGHHHCHVPEFTIGKTKLITNQLGYVKHYEHIGFEGGAVIEIEAGDDHGGKG